jgi:hypothetical protein
MDDFNVADAQHAKMINNFKNGKQKLLDSNAAIYFSKICWINQLAH